CDGAIMTAKTQIAGRAQRGFLYLVGQSWAGVKCVVRFRRELLCPQRRVRETKAGVRSMAELAGRQSPGDRPRTIGSQIVHAKYILPMESGGRGKKKSTDHHKVLQCVTPRACFESP